LKIRFISAAQEEFREAILYYNLQRPGLGATFREEVKAAIRRIVQQPLAWHLMGGNIRRCQTNRFPYGIIYESFPEEIVIIAVGHLHRSPLFWQERQ
jgi:hypothetical protein